ncbi:MAG: hypothetical protein E6G44_07775 [Actinobacteria bacterium]|nr:MAG: hypothetical protein E6G44_07775 [Actinomycetota bacterium]
MDDQMPDVLESRGGYALAEVGQEYVVFDKRQPDELLGRVPGDENGLIEAERLTSPSPLHSAGNDLVSAFLRLFFIALVVHVLSLAVVYLLQASGPSAFESTSSLIEVTQRWASAAATIANAVWFAALAAMAGIWLARHVFVKEEVSS